MSRSPAMCMNCGSAPKALPQHRCRPCLDLTLPPSEQAALALRRRENADPDYRPTADEKKLAALRGERWCGGCLSWRRYDLATGRKLDVAIGAARCRACQRVDRTRAGFGMDHGAQGAVLAAQGGKCGACGSAQRIKGLALDHDHQHCPNGTKPCGSCNRGFLCQRCNSEVLGPLHDSSGLLAALLSYLAAPPAQNVGKPPLKRYGCAGRGCAELTRTALGWRGEWRWFCPYHFTLALSKITLAGETPTIRIGDG